MLNDGRRCFFFFSLFLFLLIPSVFHFGGKIIKKQIKKIKRERQMEELLNTHTHTNVVETKFIFFNKKQTKIARHRKKSEIIIQYFNIFN